ncbi:fibronectin-binding protein [Mycolicibacterium flavescens]|nr:fibronectin-binding protein [Mycolicibacterium flavescens]MCV7283631.1 fibronectin-binding protein [Mycolicibacterium flavescens]
MLKRFTVAALVACGATLFTAAPAGAQPGGPPPCELALAFLCRYIPMAPELDHDIDLTQQQPPADPNAPLPEMRPPADPCAMGCI